MKTIKLTALLSLALLSASLWTSCTDEDLVADPTPDLSGFEQIELSGELDLVIVPGDFDIQVTGGAEVYASDELTGKLEGKCTLTYDGDPATVDVDVQGDCDLHKR
jgi:hypothetical protein